jgi:acyl-CoA synthetase (AMP-forming)/AMP-acid ligase II
MLHDLLRRSLETDPTRPILESGESWTTAAEVKRLTSRLSSDLAAMGLEEGDRVALLLPNSLESVVCYLACFRMRLVAVPLDYQYHPFQIGYALGHSGASILISHHDRIAGLDEAGALKMVPGMCLAFLGGNPHSGGVLMVWNQHTMNWIVRRSTGHIITSNPCFKQASQLCLAGSERCPNRKKAPLDCSGGAR